MLETNLRIVHPGLDLWIQVRHAAVQGSDISTDLLQRACGILRHRHGLAALPSGGPNPELLVATEKTIPSVPLEGEGWLLDVRDSGEPSRRLSLSTPEGESVLPFLIERALLVELTRKTNLWTLDSPRIWYEAKPFKTADGISAYRRYEIGSLFIEGVGVGVSVDVSTAFFTNDSLAYFFDPSVPVPEGQHRQKLFLNLTGRQLGQKGTLLYDNSRSKVKCYFDDGPNGMTCGNTGKIRVKDKTYDSLLAYYQAECPKLLARGDAPAVRVIFPGLDRPQWIAADRAYVRVMNDDVPDSLKSVDKIAPDERRLLLQKFWNRLEPKPLSGVAPGFQNGFWHPEPSRITRFIPVEVEFGGGQVLPAPSSPLNKAYREYYRQRLEYLKNAGCYAVPPAVGRTLYCAYPSALGEETGRQLAGDIADRISKWTKRPFVANLMAYENITQAIEKLRRSEQPGNVLFVLDEEPAAYHEVAFQLEGWRIKRITENVLKTYYRFLTQGAWDKKRKIATPQQGRARWDQFITMNSLDVLQQMDVVPWRTAQLGPFEAQLVIDVGHDRRHFALSLLISRATGKVPSFSIGSEVLVKPDPKHEMINPVILGDQIIELFQRVLGRRFDPINSLLVLRDGGVCGKELEGIENGVAQLIQKGLLEREVRVDVVDIHKDSLKSIRLWEIEDQQNATNPLEGMALSLNRQMVVVTTTGRATLHQGTAQPFILVGNGHCKSVLDAAEAQVGAAQLNWSSPAVAQRFSLPLKRTDEELTTRAAQEIRHIR